MEHKANRELELKDTTQVLLALFEVLDPALPETGIPPCIPSSASQHMHSLYNRCPWCPMTKPCDPPLRSATIAGPHWLALSLLIHTPGSSSLRAISSMGFRAAQKKCQGLPPFRSHLQLTGYRSQWLSTPSFSVRWRQL